MTLLKKVLAVGLVLVATQFWFGSWLMLAAFALSHIATIPFLLIPLFFKGKEILGAILPNVFVQESWPAFGLVFQGVLFSAILGLKKTFPIFVPTLLFILLAFINLRFACFAAFFLAILAANMAEKRVWLAVFVFGVVISALFFVATSQALPPNAYEIEAVQFAVKEANGTTICNQWGYGHIIEFFGGKPSDKAGGQQQCVSCVDCVMLTFELQLGCRLLKGSEEIATQIKVYRC